MSRTHLLTPPTRRPAGSTIIRRAPRQHATFGFDAFSSPAAEATGNLSWTHTPVGIPRGVAVFVLQGDSIADEVVGVTYGGVALARVAFVPGSVTLDDAGFLYFLGEGIPTAAQTVVVTRDANPVPTANKHAGCFTMTGERNVVLTAVAANFDASMTSGELSSGPVALAGHTCLLFAAAHIQNNTAAQVDASAGWTIHDEEDFVPSGNTVFEYARRTSTATGTYTTPGPWTLTNAGSCVMLVAGFREAEQVAVGVDAQLIWNTQVTLPAPELTRTELQAAALRAILAPGTQIVHRVDIYESDGETIFRRDAAFVDYTVNVNGASRDVRRTLDLVLYNDADLAPRPGGFWYDKIIKVHRGVHLDAYDVDYLVQIGVFGIAPGSLDTTTFPRNQIVVSGSDAMAALGRAKFGVPTTFATGQALEHVVETIALLGGHTRLRLHTTGMSLSRDSTFDADTTCADALQQLGGAFALDVYIDAYDYLVMRPLDDPAAAAPFITYETGDLGNVAALAWRATSERLYNDVVVSGESSDSATPPVFARAENTNPASPTRIRTDGDPGGLPRTTYRYVSAFLTTEAQCAATALSLLQRVALEDVEVAADVLVVPWLEENRVIRIVDDDPPPGEPAAQRYLLRSFPITSLPGSHQVKAKRVVAVG